MAADPTIIAASADYIRIESIANVFAVVGIHIISSMVMPFDIWVYESTIIISLYRGKSMISSVVFQHFPSPANIHSARTALSRKRSLRLPRVPLCAILWRQKSSCFHGGTMRTLHSRITWIPAVLWYGIIWYFSSQPGSTSSDVSADVIKGALISGGSDFSSANESVRLAVSWMLSFFVRKAAHMFLFFMLALLIWLALVPRIRSRVKRAAAAATCGTLLAALDEYHQTLVPGRSGELRDVLVDLAGILIALALFALPWFAQQIRCRLAKPERLWYIGGTASAVLLVWVGTLNGVAPFFIHRAHQLDFFAWMDDIYFNTLMDACAPILKQALYLAACAVAGFLCVLLAILSETQRSRKSAMLTSTLLCILAALLWDLPLLPGATLALLAGGAAYVLWKFFPFLRL